MQYIPMNAGFEERQKMAEKIAVVCMECAKKFKTANLCPVCPKCNSSDIEPRE
jgi:Zn finger protein HypA/HybF involved in hydrogenase expression